MSHPLFDNLPRIIGHRGACGHAPENTLASIRKAAELGARFIEIDVTLTSDNVAVIQHDTGLNRCTNGKGPIILTPLEEVKKLDAGGWFSDEFKGETVPTLREAVDLIHELGLGLNLEIKPSRGWQVPTATQVCCELASYAPEDMPLLFSSFDPEALVIARDMMPDVPRGYLTETIFPDWKKRLDDLGCEALHCEKYFVTKEKVAEIKSAGYKLLVYTVNDPEMGKCFLDWGVDAIITDFPDRIGNIL